MQDAFVAGPGLLADAIDHARAIAERLPSFQDADDSEGPSGPPSMSRDAALDLLSRPWPVTVGRHEVTGLHRRGPQEAIRAIRALALHKTKLSGREIEVVCGALAHYGPGHDGLIAHVWLWLQELLADAAEPHLAAFLPHATSPRHVVWELSACGRASASTVLAVAATDSVVAEHYVRSRFAYDADLARALRHSDEPRAARALSLGAVDHDPQRIRAAWERSREAIPAWRVSTAFAPRGLVPCDAGIAFLHEQDTRRWVRGFELELWPGYDLRRNEDAGIWSLARHDPERRLVLIAPPDDDALVAAIALTADRDALRLGIEASTPGRVPYEGRLCLPRVTHIIGPRRVERISWLDATHGSAIRVGGLDRYHFDRPFLLIDWDSRIEAALGVGLVTGPLLVRDTLDWLSTRVANSEA